MSVLNEIEATVSRLAATAGEAVVGVGSGWRVATGFAVAPGRFLTVADRVGDGEAVITFGDGREGRGRLVAVDRDLGLAVLELAGDEAADAVAPLAWAGDEPGVGAAVVALAKPGGRGLRASLGFVVAAGRAIRGARGRRIEGALEHSAALPRGAAGGPLLDAEGRVVGINALRVEGGLIVALGPSVRDRVEQLARGEVAEPRYLGVAVAPPRVARRLQRALGLPERDGVLIRAVQEGTAAERAGLERGDLIVAAGGDAIAGIDALHAAVAAASQRLELKVVRGGDERDLVVDLAEPGS